MMYLVVVNDTATTEIYTYGHTLSLHDALPIYHAADAAYVVLIPMAAVLFASVGRHPLAGIAAALAAVSGGYAGNIMPGQLDVLLFGFTQEAARIVEPGWTMNPLGNWYFILGVVVFFTPIIWFVKIGRAHV